MYEYLIMCDLYLLSGHGVLLLAAIVSKVVQEVAAAVSAARVTVATSGCQCTERQAKFNVTRFSKVHHSRER